MPTSRPFAYNTGTTISGTQQFGSIAVGTPTSGVTGNPRWWNGPDEELGYVIAQSVSENTQPAPDGSTASIGFFRSTALTESSFIQIAQRVSVNQTFATGNDAYLWLTGNSYWSSWVYTASSGNLRVLILGDGNVNTVSSNISTYLTNTGNSITYSAVTMGSTYTGSGNITKSNYDVVMIYTNSGQVGTTTLANALTTFVSQGGSIVSGVFLWNLYPTGYNFTGTTAFNVTNSQSSSVGSFTAVTATTITNGIGTSLPSSFTNSNPSLVSGAIALARFTNNEICLALKTVGSSRNISINAWPGNITTSTSTICKMFGNAILYAGGKLN